LIIEIGQTNTTLRYFKNVPIK